MAHSREVRLPFLERRVAEFCLSLPAGFVYRDGVTKAVLRDAVRASCRRRCSSAETRSASRPPQAAWLLPSRHGSRGSCEVLLDPAARARGLLDLGAVEADAAAGRWRDSSGIWRALNLELWLRSIEGRPSAERRRP